MPIRSFSQYITEAPGKSVYIGWGRFNPPTIGHEKLIKALAKAAGSNQFFVLPTQSQDKKKNPLQFSDKVKMLRKMFPKYGRNILMHKYKTLFDVATDMYDKGYTELNILAGSDRVAEYEALMNKYNGTQGRHGFYNFKVINIISAGQRDPDAEGAEGMSASKLRDAAANNDFATFMKGMPTGFKDARELFNLVRTGMGLSESTDFRAKVKFEPISEEREEYVHGNLFREGEEVIIKESGELATITVLGSNYVIVETSNGKYRKWIDAVEKLEEDKEPTWDSYTEEVETKPSKYTKRFKDMFGETKLEEQDAKVALKAKADKTGIPYSILKTVFDRGYAAWKTGHRPGTNPTQWGLARVNSFATGGKTQKTADADLWKKYKEGKK